MKIHALLPFLSSLIFLTAGIAIYLLNKENGRNAFLRFCYFTFHWQFTWFFMFSAGNEVNAMLIARIGYSGIIFIPAAFYESTCSYLQIKTITTRIVYLLSILFLITLWTTDYFITGCYSAYFGYYPKAGLLHIVYMLMVGFVVTNSVLAITNKIRSNKNNVNRSPMTLFYSGLLVYSGAAVDYLLNYPDLLSAFKIKLYPFGVLFIIISIFLFLLAHKIRINRFLELQIEEKTDALKKSLHMLEEVQEAKKFFIASIAHDLKNPLSVISGYSQILEKKLLPGTKEQTAAESIHICANQIDKLIDSLIQVSLLESNELKPDLDTYNYSCFINDYLKRFEEKAVVKNIRLCCHTPVEKVIVKSDILWLERILGNLIQNAFKYVDNGGSIDVKVYVDRQYIHTEVIDTGIGIPEEKLGLIFIRKYQAHKELKKEGYGLGLSIVKEMLEILGGTIGVESQESVGTRFTYSLLLHADQNAPAKNDALNVAKQVERRCGTDRRKVERIKEIEAIIDENTRVNTIKCELTQFENSKPNCKGVLICDDNSSHLRLMADLLFDDYNLFLAENGDDGLKKLTRFRSIIGAVLTDVEMPVMNGITLCNKIRKADELQGIPVIVMSSYYNDTDKAHAINNGATCYIAKNKTKEEMVALLKQYF